MIGELTIVEVLKGSLSGEHTLKGVLQNGSTLVGKFSFNRECYHDIYDGDYTIDPSFELQTLETENKLMREDVNVNPIEVSRVSNLSGGVTVYIGGII